MASKVGHVFAKRYKINKKIGTGGMADVYEATDTVLDRPVAVKVLHPQFAEEKNFVARFKQEAQAVANLSHPNIVSVYDWGSEEDTYYIVMEHLEGRDLKQVIDERAPLLPEITLDIARQVASALSYAHKNEIIHRDIKPHNIFITTEGEVKVTDFGIARAGTSSITQTGAILGTAHYISPEQARGRVATIQSDLYSLGVVMYEMLTGRVPFQGESPVAIATKHVHEQPVAPSSINPEIPEELEAVILKALSKHLDDRFQSADELKRALARAAEELPEKTTSMFEERTMLLTPPSSIRRRAQPEREKKNWLPYFGLVFAFLLLAIGCWTYSVFFKLPQVVVPLVEGKTIKEAEKILKTKGLKLKVKSRVYDPKVEPGLIISQNPDAGEKLEKGKTVEVKVSKGEKLIEVPDLTGKTQPEAAEILLGLGLKIGSISKEFSEFDEDTIITTNPKMGEKVPEGTPVDLVISQGIELVIVPDVKGMNVDEATQTIIQKGLKYSLNFEYNDDEVGVNRVIRQNPSYGEEVNEDTVVILVVSRGPETVTVPNVVGKDSVSAKIELEGLGFRVDILTSPVTSSAQVGKVQFQSPSGGNEARKGSSVTIWVGV